MGIPIWLAKSLIPAIGSIAGGSISSIGQHFANEANKEIARMQNRHNEVMMREQNAWNLAQWHRQNAYNTPLAQRKRFEEAGINPALALGNISAGTAEALTSAAAQPAAGANMLNSLAPFAAGVSGAANSLIQMEQMKMSRDLVDAQVYKLVKEGDAVSIDNNTRGERNKLDIESVRTEIDAKKFNLEYLRDMTPYQKMSLIAEINQKVSMVDVNKSVADLNYDELKNLRPMQRKELQSRISSVFASIGYMHIQGKLAQSQMALLAEQCVTEQAKQMNLHVSNKQIEALIRPTIAKMMSEAKKADADANYTSEQTSYLGQDNARKWINSISSAWRDLGIGTESFVGAADKGMDVYLKAKTGGLSGLFGSKSQSSNNQQPTGSWFW